MRVSTLFIATALCSLFAVISSSAPESDYLLNQAADASKQDAVAAKSQYLGESKQDQERVAAFSSEQDAFDFAPLIDAVYNSRIDAARTALSLLPRNTAFKTQLEALLLHAASHNQVEMLDLLKKELEDFWPFMTKTFEDVLVAACESGSAQVLDYLLSNFKPHMKISNQKYGEALYKAASMKQWGMVIGLVQAPIEKDPSVDDLLPMLDLAFRDDHFCVVVESIELFQTVGENRYFLQKVSEIADEDVLLKFLRNVPESSEFDNTTHTAVLLICNIAVTSRNENLLQAIREFAIQKQCEDDFHRHLTMLTVANGNAESLLSLWNSETTDLDLRIGILREITLRDRVDLLHMLQLEIIVDPFYTALTGQISYIFWSGALASSIQCLQFWMNFIKERQLDCMRIYNSILLSKTKMADLEVFEMLFDQVYQHTPNLAKQLAEGIRESRAQDIFVIARFLLQRLESEDDRLLILDAAFELAMKRFDMHFAWDMLLQMPHAQCAKETRREDFVHMLLDSCDIDLVEKVLLHYTLPSKHEEFTQLAQQSKEIGSIDGIKDLLLKTPWSRVYQPVALAIVKGVLSSPWLKSIIDLPKSTFQDHAGFFVLALQAAEMANSDVYSHMLMQLQKTDKSFTASGL